MSRRRSRAPPRAPLHGRGLLDSRDGRFPDDSIARTRGKSVQRYAKRTAVIAAVAATCLLSAAAAPAFATPSSPNSANATNERDSRASVVVPLRHAVTLADAVAAVHGAGADVDGYRFEDSWIVGEYYPSGTLQPADFVRLFAEYHGTEPQIVGFVLKKEASTQRTAARSASDLDGAVALASARPTFEAPPAKRGRSAKLLSTAATATVESTAATATQQAIWAPNYAETYAMGFADLGYPDLAAIGTYSEWSYNSGRAPTNMPDDWGMEIDVYLKNDELSGTRPNCADGYLDQFWAAKFDLPGEQSISSWEISTSEGEPISLGGSAGHAEAYFDWEDASDSCSEQSFTIGIGNPHGMATVQSGLAWGVNTTIWTARGTASSSPMGGYYQAVSNDCNDLGIDADTTCMGLNTWRTFPASGGAQTQPLLNPDTRTAEGCYATTNTDGTSTAVPISCWW